jgi:hypothetical protein
LALAAEAIVVPLHMATHARKPNKRFINTILSPRITDTEARSRPTAHYIASFALKGGESLRITRIGAVLVSWRARAGPG